jgi:hypothetical protein
MKINTMTFGSSLFSIEYGAPKQQAPKLQAPSSKLQGSSKSQPPNQGRSDVVANPGRCVEVWGLELLWRSLGFEASTAE